MDVFFWFMVGVGLFVLLAARGSGDFWLVFWLCGYVVLLGGVVADILSGAWHDSWDDYMIGMSLVVGWVIGPLMWLVGFGLYWQARDFVSGGVVGDWFVVFVLGGGNGLVYYGLARFLGFSHGWGIVCGLVGVLVGVWLVWEINKVDPKTL